MHCRIFYVNISIFSTCICFWGMKGNVQVDVLQGKFIISLWLRLDQLAKQSANI